MARYTGPSWRQSRRVGISLTETGKELRKRPFAPGQHGQRRTKKSEYGLQLTEKQKVRFMYGMTEKQFRKTFDKSGKMDGKHGENFLFLLESRLDSIVYRLGLSRTRRGARQLVNHGHILVDGKKVDIASFIVKPGQTISVKEASKSSSAIKDALESTISRLEFVSFDETSMSGTFIRLPERSELNQEVNEALIVEFYNR